MFSAVNAWNGMCSDVIMVIHGQWKWPKPGHFLKLMMVIKVLQICEVAIVMASNSYSDNDGLPSKGGYKSFPQSCSGG